MKVLFVEDENVKQSNIVTYLKDELGVENISVVNSLMGGMLALRNGKFDIVLLDMSLPLYDINGEDEELNEFEAFGGIEILDEIDRKILETMIIKYQGKPIGIEALATTVGEDIDTLEDVYEPYLIQIGFISRTQRGRVPLPAAYKHIGASYQLQL